jgi:alkyldihydroxyacetonephosphate synthase
VNPLDRPPVPISVDAGPPTPPSRFTHDVVVEDAVLARLRDVCVQIDTGVEGRLDAGRDWWPLALTWAAAGTVPAWAAVVARPSDSNQVAAVLRVCNESRVPVTAFAGRSGVCGGSIPAFGGVSLDLTGLEGVVGVDSASLLVDVRAGTFGDSFEQTLRSSHGLTLGHWPQSIAVSTVGGWLACRGAGQFSTRYGKIEDMVVGLEVALASGRLIRTGGRAPRAACGPDLTQLFVGSEGTLGIITEARLRAHPRPAAERRAAYRFRDFAAGLDACRRILRRGATPAVLRLYDAAEAGRSFDVQGGAALIVLDEGDPGLIDAVMVIVHEETEETEETERLDGGLVEQWLQHRNVLPPLEALVKAGIVADTVEISASWSALPTIYREAVDALTAIDGTLAASAHQSHAYGDGACLYFTFAGRPIAPDRAETEAYYRRAWDAIVTATNRAGGALSHHHGVGINRSRYMSDFLGSGFEVLTAVKSALDPLGILNPGKLGLPSPFGPPPWS